MEVLRAVALTGARTQGLATHAALMRNGVSRAALSRAVADGRVVRVMRRVYALDPLGPVPRHLVTDGGVAPAYVRVVRASLLSLGPHAAAAGRTAAACYGWGLLVEPGRSVEVAVAHGRGTLAARDVLARQRRDVEICRRAVVPGAAPLALTRPEDTVLECARSLPLLQGVVLADSALRAGDVALDGLWAAAERQPGHPGAARARAVVDRADPLSGSVLESVLRVRFHEAGLAGWMSQVVLSDDPGPHLRVDFCFTAAGLVVEADGARWHRDPERDQVRDNLLAALGWRVLRFTWADVVHDHRRVIAEVQTALACSAPSRRSRHGVALLSA